MPPGRRTEKSSLLSNGNKTDAAAIALNISSDEDGESDLLLSNMAPRVKCISSNMVPLIPHVKPNQRHRTHRCVRRTFRMLMCTMIPFLLFMLCYMSVYSTLPQRHFELPDWTYNTSRNLAVYIYPENDTVVIEPRNICNEKLFVLVIVCSGVHNFIERQIIRETWGNTTEFNYGMFAQLHSHLKGEYLDVLPERVQHYGEYLGVMHNDTVLPPILPVRVVFLIGRSKASQYAADNATTTRLRMESQQYDDIIQEDFIDTYNNLTLKTVFALKWIKRRCLQQRSAFFVKCDDDSFINIPNLLHYLLGGTVPIYNDTLDLYDSRSYKALSARNRLTVTRDYLAGYVFCTARPVSEHGTKWYMPWYMYPNEKYPVYLSGAGYIMSADVVPRLYEAALKVPLLHLEDVYLTGLCASQANVTRRHTPLFNYARTKHYCGFKGTALQHGLKAQDGLMTEVYDFVRNVDIRCRPPNKFFKRIRIGLAAHCTQASV